MTELRLETPSLYLRLKQPSDLDDLPKIFGDPKSMASFGAAPFSREQMKWWRAKNPGHQEVHGYGLFSVILKAEELLIGDCGLEQMVVDGKQVMVLWLSE